MRKTALMLVGLGMLATVEAVTGKRTFSDGARVVEVLHITDTVLPAGAPAHPAQVNLAGRAR